MRVLIVDDNEPNLYLLRALLEGHGCTVEDARHGAEALAKARRSPPQLVISDLLMPVMDGYTLLRHWKTDDVLKAIPFIVYTATYTESKDERLALDLGADAFILKPAEPEPFMNRLRETLSKREDNGSSLARSPQNDESALLRDYNAVVVRKLEKKTVQLEEANRALRADMAERKRLEEERWAMEIQLRQQQKLEAIGTLAGGMAHEINNPINGIMNYAQLLRDQLPGASQQAEYAGEILRETERIANIVRNLLTFARVEKQSHSLGRIADIVQSTLSLVQAIMRHDQITLAVHVPEDLPELRCHSQQLQQVLMNLMTNARDALNERYPGHHEDKVLNVSARLLDKEGHTWLRLTVEDHGTGIAPEVRERMFDPFFTTKPRDRGTGLGLAISHGIVKEHHGQMLVESEPGRFTRIHVDLPVEK